MSRPRMSAVAREPPSVAYTAIVPASGASTIATQRTLSLNGTCQGYASFANRFVKPS
jgi:hypothetical protein